VRTFDAELAAMVERGFSPALALRTVSALTYYVNGFVQQEQLAAGPHAEPAAERVDPAALEGGTLLAALAAGASPLGEQTFAHGLRALLDGTAVALAAEGNCDHSNPGR
jgi:TetR/AcrR family tetracycline transcriptional repressor